MKADLHCHTEYSDGALSPLALFERAKERGIELIAVTDHDTMAANDACVAASQETGVAYLPAIEISAYDEIEKKRCHIIGLNLQEASEALNAVIESIRSQRQAISLKQIEGLQKMNYAIALDDFEERRHALGIYKQHIMEVLIAKGYATAQYDALYYELFKGNSPLNLEISYPSAEKVVALLRDSGAIPVLAHPTLYGNLGALDRLMDSGLMGIEAVYPSVTKEDYERIVALAAQHNLRLCGGSDFHGDLGGTTNGDLGSWVVDWD